MGTVKTQHDWYVEHERELDQVVGEVVLYNVTTLVSDMMGSKWDDEIDEFSYKVDDSFEEEGAEPTYIEALEYWLVDDWFGENLKQKGELVGELCNLTIWGRSCTGQAISLDYVVQEVLKDIVENRRKYG